LNIFQNIATISKKTDSIVDFGSSDHEVTLTLYRDSHNEYNTKLKGGEILKKIMITLLFIFLSMSSGLNFAAENNGELMAENDEKGTGKIDENMKKIEESNLTKHALGKGRTVGILMLALLLLIVALKYIRGY
jgi:hypothetical protein